MKALKLFLLAICYFASASIFAQTPQSIEADLLKSFKKIDYWDQKQRSGNINAVDSLGDANDRFGKKLANYTQKYPFTLTAAFPALKKAQLNMFTSADGMLKIYSWDTWLGGTMHSFANVLQFRSGQKTYSELLTRHDGAIEPFYSNLYTFKIGNKTYYFGVYGGSESTKYFYAGINTFAIENGKLKTDVSIIKTKSGLQNGLSYEFDFSLNKLWEEIPAITFDAATKAIRLPLVNNKGKVTKKFITYKFTGKYFEKVSNLAK